MARLIQIARGRIDFLAAIAVFLSASAFYVAALEGEFVFDDLPLLSSDPFYHEGAGSSLPDCFTRTYWRKELSQGLYRPVTLASYLLNAKFAGLYPPSFRAVNIVCHALVSMLLYLLFLSVSKGRMPAFAAAMIFAVHPLHSEAVIPASGRAELLCALFLVLGMLFHAGNWRFRPLLLFVCGLLAMLCKENGIVLLPVCLAFDLVLRNCEFRKASPLKDTRLQAAYAALALAVVVYFAMRTALVSSPFPRFSDAIFFSDNHLGFLGFWERLPSVLWLQGLALWKFICPAHLAHDYSFAQILPIMKVSDIRTLQLLAFIAALCLLVFLLIRENRRFALFCIVAYSISVLPVANLITPTGTIFGERLYYFPSAFLCMAVASEAGFLSRKLGVSRKSIGISALLVFAALFVRLSLRIPDWKDFFSIAEAGVRTSPLSFKMWNNYALQLLDKGMTEEAEKGFSRSIEINPSNMPALRNRGYARIKLGKNKEALDDLKECIRLGTGDPEVYNKAGALSAMAGRRDDAIRMWEKSLDLKPGQRKIAEALEDLKAGK